MAFSASRTDGSTSGFPASFRYAPSVKSILPGNGSFWHSNANPRIEFGGHSSTSVKKEAISSTGRGVEHEVFACLDQ
jgi:hypothetical protein